MNKKSKKDLIADSALSCFLTAGYNNTSVDEIVRASGVSKGGIYWHFKSKEDIFVYIIERQISMWFLQFLSSLSEGDSASVKLTKYINHYLKNVDTPITALISEFFMQTRDEEILKRIHSSALKKQTVLREIVATAVSTGEFSDIDIDAATATFMALIDGLMHQWMITKDKQSLKHNITVALQIFLRGIKPN